MVHTIGTSKIAMLRLDPQVGERSPDSVHAFTKVSNDVDSSSPTSELTSQVANQAHEVEESMEYSSRDGSESYLALHTLDSASVHTGQYVNSSHNSFADATETIHEMHVALLYLLSHPEEFQRALTSSTPHQGTTLSAWNAECENESVASASVYTENCTSPSGNVSSTPLPFAVFADDAEVVLPQAHTVSQLFGVEISGGIELEAAAGIPSISQIFLRWLALMPGGDHLNLIEPPGLTVMRIAGGRYRVTAAHRVVWTWMNSIAGNALQPGELVTMTIVDVFETDSQGKLLSYCPTFDNRAVYRTHATAEALRKSSTRFASAIQSAQKSNFGRLLVRKATHMAKSVQQHIQGKADAPPSRRISSREFSLDMPQGTERHEV